jgi:hypothetical protein
LYYVLSISKNLPLIRPGKDRQAYGCTIFSIVVACAWALAAGRDARRNAEQTLTGSFPRLFRGLLEVLSVDPTGNTDIFSRVFMHDHINDLRIRPDRVVRDLDDVPDELFTSLMRETALDMAFDERHDGSPVVLFKTFNKVFVVRRTLDILGKMLTMLDEINSASFANHEKNVFLRFTRRGANHPE